VRIAGVLTCSLVNGEGIRYVIFTQGCKHHCPGCHNPETWDFNGGYEVSVEELAEDIRKHRMIDGITLSGGDPMEQEAECLALLDLLPAMNVWVYTGYEWEEIADRELVKRADAVVVGKFVESLRCEGKHYGSSNQRIVRRSEGK
jgi:anaerobic ribonucleoside-triphosphate reductase activating protein